ncbi:MAG: molybdate ABC transporter substrate-binding protein [Pseudonocardia sp.]|nr:molybdate ABC transporter substrate-binding protein [Pseudonocardia sp.]
MSDRRYRVWRQLALAAAVLLAVAGCGSGGGEQQAPAQPAAGGEATVFAAASLTEAFTQLGKDFQAANPGSTVTFNFAGSSTLSRQIGQGAPAGVFASANNAQMKKVVDGGMATGQPRVFVTNKLQIVVPKGNPAGITGLADFGKQDLKIAICAEQVPCGALSKQLFQTAGVTPAPDTQEQDVKAVLTKVSLGEADAGLVYRTDVASAGDKVQGIEFPEADTETNEYPIVALKNAPNPQVAQAFVDYVLSPAGQQVLERFGFTPAAS